MCDLTPTWKDGGKGYDKRNLDELQSEEIENYMFKLRTAVNIHRKTLLNKIKITYIFF